MFKRLKCWKDGHVVSNTSVNDKGDFKCERCGKLLSMRDLADNGSYEHRNVRCPHCGMQFPILRDQNLEAEVSIYKYKDRADEVVEESMKKGRKSKEEDIDYVG